MLLIFFEVIIIISLVLVYVFREAKRQVKFFRSGDIIWVRGRILKPEKAILSNWDDYTFSYLPDNSHTLKVKSWFFFVKNDSFQDRQKQV